LLLNLFKVCFHSFVKLINSFLVVFSAHKSINAAKPPNKESAAVLRSIIVDFV
jgi:hypothetical protein